MNSRNDDNFTKLPLKGCRPIKLASFSEIDYIKIKKNQNDICDSIKSVYSQYPSLSENYIITLLLLNSLKTHDFDLKRKLFRFIYEKEIQSIDLLVSLDENGKNTILYALENGIGVESLSAYIFYLTENKKINEKYIMEKELQEKIAVALKHPQTEVHPWVLIQNLIEPLYTAESFKQLIETIDENWLNSYYI